MARSLNVDARRSDLDRIRAKRVADSRSTYVSNINHAFELLVYVLRTRVKHPLLHDIQPRSITLVFFVQNLDPSWAAKIEFGLSLITRCFIVCTFTVHTSHI
jgi:hypothetical protein